MRVIDPYPRPEERIVLRIRPLVTVDVNKDLGGILWRRAVIAIHSVGRAFILDREREDVPKMILSTERG